MTSAAIALPRARRGNRIGDLISWAFGTATVVTNLGKAMAADRLRTTPATFTVSPHFVAMGVGATGAARTAAVTDVALSTEVETRANGTESVVTTTVTNDTTQVVGTITATASRSVDEGGLFNASSSVSMGTSATFPVVSLASGDSLQFTWKVQFS